MGKSLSGGENDDIDWDTEDELEIQGIHDTTFSACTNLRTSGQHADSADGEARSLSVPCQSKFIEQFVMMGFPEESIAKAIEQNGENPDLVLNALLTFKALEDSPEEQSSASPQLNPCISSDDSSFDCDENFLDDIYEEDNWSSDSDDCLNSAAQCYLKEDNHSSTQMEPILLSLANMGYPLEDASIAMERCGPEASLLELTDFISAAQMARAEDAYFPEDIKPNPSNMSSEHKKRKMYNELCKRKKHREIFEEETIRLPNPMIGFGIPTTESSPTAVRRTLSEQAIGPPFFYYENVALTPKGVWDTISRSLYDTEPEFVDSIYFCATARKRGYVHNLPIENRFPLLPLPPCTIHEALPLTKKWWPSWDTRTKLNCIQTCMASAKLTDRIRKVLEKFDGEPPEGAQKLVLEQLRTWNLVWVGRNKVAPLEPDEVEMLLGFPKNHTRGGTSRTDRYKSLGNSFQVDTVAYHLSVLKDLYPKGINVLSLFSGIGGAEVALYRLGIPLNNVVSVEISEVNRDIVRSWWEQTNQRGNLIEFHDVQQLNGDHLERLIESLGGFDLVIGGSPCNNLTGSNRVSRDGLGGTDSALFYHFPRILDLVKSLMSRRQVDCA